MQGGKRSLRIEIDREHTMAGQGHVLRQMGGRCRLAGAALEIDDTDDLKFLITATMRDVALDLGAAILIQPLAQFLYLLDAIGAATTCQNGRLDTFTFQV